MRFIDLLKQNWFEYLKITLKIIVFSLIILIPTAAHYIDNNTNLTVVTKIIWQIIGILITVGYYWFGIHPFGDWLCRILKIDNGLVIWAFIEYDKFGVYTVYTKNINHTIIGTGLTLGEAINDFENSINEVIGSYKNEKMPLELVDFHAKLKYKFI